MKVVKSVEGRKSLGRIVGRGRVRRKSQCTSLQNTKLPRSRFPRNFCPKLLESQPVARNCALPSKRSFFALSPDRTQWPPEDDLISSKFTARLCTCRSTASQNTVVSHEAVPRLFGMSSASQLYQSRFQNCLKASL